MASAPLLVLGPFFADQIWGQGSKGLGFLMASFGVGAVVGTLTLARKAATADLAKVAMWNAALMGSALVAMAWAPNFYAGMVVMLASGFGVFRQNAASNTYIQQTVTEDFRGRVLSLYSMMAVGMIPIGSLTAGFLAHNLGARLTVALGGGVALAAAALFARHLSTSPTVEAVH